jgi:uncharacterized protein with ParB-like and HNH nuclease domain
MTKKRVPKYLTVKTGDIPRLKDVYEAFKAHSLTPAVAEAGVEAMVKDIRDFARNFCAIALGAESDPELKRAFHYLRELKVDVAYPFLLELYHDYAGGLLSRDNFVQSVRLLEAYVFRRAICAIPTNSMNKTFSTFTKALNKDHYLESIQAHFLLLPSYRRFPRDEEFHRDLQKRDLYNFRSRSYAVAHFSIGKEYTMLQKAYEFGLINKEKAKQIKDSLKSKYEESLGSDEQTEWDFDDKEINENGSSL